MCSAAAWTSAGCTRPPRAPLRRSSLMRESESGAVSCDHCVVVGGIRRAIWAVPTKATPRNRLLSFRRICGRQGIVSEADFPSELLYIETTKRGWMLIGGRPRTKRPLPSARPAMKPSAKKLKRCRSSVHILRRHSSASRYVELTSTCTPAATVRIQGNLRKGGCTDREQIWVYGCS